MSNWLQKSYESKADQTNEQVAEFRTNVKQLVAKAAEAADQLTDLVSDDSWDNFYIQDCRRKVERLERACKKARQEIEQLNSWRDMAAHYSRLAKRQEELNHENS